MNTVQHSSFTVERLLPARPQHAYRFWADPALRERWTSCHPDWSLLEETIDFRIGGQHLTRMRPPGGSVQTVDIRYLDLLEGQRIVYAYSMHLDHQPLSASLVTIELLPGQDGTRMVYVEQLAMLSGDPELRRRGTDDGFDRLVTAVEREVAVLQ